jgi:hypothetical protein
MNQVRRLSSLADDNLQMRGGRHSLAVFWLTVCAETVAKLHDAGEAEEGSRKAVHRFFETFLSSEEKQAIGSGLRDARTNEPLGLQKTVDALYDVRCDVAHEGNYWDLRFYGGGTPLLDAQSPIIASMSLHEFRTIVVRGGIRAARWWGSWSTTSGRSALRVAGRRLAQYRKAYWTLMDSSFELNRHRRSGRSTSMLWL